MDWLAENKDYPVDDIKLVGFHPREQKLLQTYLEAVSNLYNIFLFVLYIKAQLQIAPPRRRPTPKTSATPSTSRVTQPTIGQTPTTRTTRVPQPTAQQANVPPVRVIDAGAGGDCLHRLLLYC